MSNTTQKYDYLVNLSTQEGIKGFLITQHETKSKNIKLT